ncbi:MAG TPA: 50S ribosomal protein L21 [Bacteroidota bacterium]|jgi:large subunit ribosomal protein L21|nr:50S ribosomal protein L21 [Bacteroidota bacterium]
MFAVVEIAGSQVKVTENEKIFVPKLESEVGSTVRFDKVMLKSADTSTTVGTPFVKDAFVEATVLRHLKDDKVTVFKKKKRKGYRVQKGHRQQYTEIEITKVA